MRIEDRAVGPFERVVWAVDEDRRLRVVVAVHSTALGPAVGGCRVHPYPDSATAVIDCLRLADGMTLKSAAAGLDLGGGKAVIIGEPGAHRTEAAFDAFAKVLDHLGGEYYTAEDVGTSSADMDALRRRTPYALGVSEALGGCGDPSPYTARGVAASMTAAWHAAAGAGLDGVRVLVQGVGKVGAEVARLARDAGAVITVCDVDEARAAAVAERLGGRAIPVAEALTADCDVLCPCALGGVIAPEDVAGLACRVVCGAANNQLTSGAVATALADRGVLYVPDFVANAGGIIAVAQELHGFDHERAIARADAIGDQMAALLDEADRTGRTPLDVAHLEAHRRIEHAQHGTASLS